MKTNTLILRLAAVEKSFREPAGVLRVLDRLDLSVAPGEIVLLQGPSGSGKTTLLQITGCLLRADKGLVELAGQNLNEAPEIRRTLARQQHLGFCFQQFHLLESLTVRDNVALGLRLKRQHVDKMRVDERAFFCLVGGRLRWGGALVGKIRPAPPAGCAQSAGGSFFRSELGWWPEGDFAERRTISDKHQREHFLTDFGVLISACDEAFERGDAQ